MPRSTVLVFAVLLLSWNATAQRQGDIWYFGDHAGLDFSAGDPAVLQDGQTHYVGCSACHAEGSSVLCDDQGSLLFYTDGQQVWNADQEVMPNGDGLLSNASATQSALILPRPGSDEFYYVFTVDDFFFDQLQYGFRYSVVDMCLDDGLGDVDTREKNILLLDTVAEKLAVVRNANGTDFWVIVEKFFSNAFYAYPLTSVGVGTPVISFAGTVQPTGTAGIASAMGQLKASPNGEKLVSVNGNSTPSIAEYFDFDPATGVVSNAVQLAVSDIWNYYGASFSPDNSKLYISSILNGNGVYQFNMDAGGGDPAAVVASMTQIASYYNYMGLQLANNGKIYVARSPFSNNHMIGVINDPNNTGAACDYEDEAISLGAAYASYGFPSFLDSYDYTNRRPSCITTVDEEINRPIRLSPNPMVDHAMLTLNGEALGAFMELRSADGRLMRTYDPVSTGNVPIHRNGLDGGAYFIHICARDGTVITIPFVILDQ